VVGVVVVIYPAVPVVVAVLARVLFMIRSLLRLVKMWW
jgi:hypothetical protein